jgi:hypothetical protein
MNRGEFGRECFKRVSVPANGKTLTFFVAWCAFENTQALNNPCATEERFGNSTDFNSAGVQNYPTWQDGVDAWVLTITNGFYNNLLKVLRKSTSTPRAMLNALDNAPWGSHPNTVLYELVEKEYDKYNVEVPGSGGVVKHRSVVSRIESLFKPVLSNIKENSNMDVTTASQALVAAMQATPFVQADVDAAQANLLAAVAAAQAGTTVSDSEAAVEAVEAVAVPEVDTLEDRIAAIESTPPVDVPQTPFTPPSATVSLADAQAAATTVVAFLAQ